MGIMRKWGSTPKRWRGISWNYVNRRFFFLFFWVNFSFFFFLFWEIERSTNLFCVQKKATATATATVDGRWRWRWRWWWFNDRIETIYLAATGRGGREGGRRLEEAPSEPALHSSCLLFLVFLFYKLSMEHTLLLLFFFFFFFFFFRGFPLFP